MTTTGDEAEALTLMIIFSSNWQDSAGLWLLASTIEGLVVNRNLEMIRTQTDLLKFSDIMFSSYSHHTSHA